MCVILCQCLRQEKWELMLKKDSKNFLALLMSGDRYIKIAYVNGIKPYRDLFSVSALFGN